LKPPTATALGWASVYCTGELYRFVHKGIPVLE